MSEAPVEVRPIAGVNTRMCVVGEGQPVLALHGWGGSIESFWPVAEKLQPLGYQVHLLDLPGFGRSALPPADWGVADYANFVRTYLSNAGLEQIALLGHSFGGRIGLLLAAEHPALISRMVLADSAGLRTQLSTKQRVRNAIARSVRRLLRALQLRRLEARIQERYNRRFASEDFLNAGPLRNTFLRVIQQDLAPFAVRVQAPTVLIWGENDTDTPLWQGQKLEELIPDAGLIVFQGAGHFAYLENLNDYIRIVDNFLSNGN